MKQCPQNMLVAMAEGAKQRTHLSAPAASPRELQVGFKGFPVGMGRGAAALEGTLATPAEALELCSTATPHACFFLWPTPEEATRSIPDRIYRVWHRIVCKTKQKTIHVWPGREQFKLNLVRHHHHHS